MYNRGMRETLLGCVRFIIGISQEVAPFATRIISVFLSRGMPLGLHLLVVKLC